MFQQNLLDSLQSIFGGGFNWNQLSGMGSEDIASSFAQHYDIEEQDLPAGMFQSITPEMLRGASYKTYAPQIQAQGQSFLPDLYKNLGGQAATKAKNNMMSSVCGHTHTEAYCKWFVGKRFRVFGMQVGCGVNADTYAAAYARNFKRQAIGAAVILNNGTLPINLLMPL